MRTNRLDEARTALKHLPAGPGGPAEVHRLAAWLAAARRDIPGQRQALTSLVAETPEDLRALERLEALGPADAGTAADRPPRRAEIERAAARYRALYRRNQPSRDAEEMAGLAQRLGHRFEAIVCLTAALADEPDRADLRAAARRLEAAAREPHSPGRRALDSHLQPAKGLSQRQE
jgi:hypothetical protein